MIKKGNISFSNIIFYILILFIILAGFYIRTKLYLLRAPFWLDEMMLGYSFTDYSFGDMLTKCLAAFQKAPPLFNIIVLFIRRLFGINELTLRFIPYLSGMLAILGFVILLKKNIKSKIGVVIGLLLFVFCVPLVYFCAEFKPYGFDVFISILLLLSYKYINFSNITHKRAICYAVCSVFLIFLSFPTIFLIPAIVSTKMIENRKDINYKYLWFLVGILFAGLYLYLYDSGTYNYLKDYWGSVEKGFCSFPTLQFLWKYIYDSVRFYIYHFDTNYIWPLVAYLVGGFIIYCKEKSHIAKILIFTMLFLLIAASLQVYPFKPKLTLFLAPLFILLIAKVFDFNYHIKSLKLKYIYSILLCMGLFVITGIKIPYINITEDDIVYYNKDLGGRNKTIDDRTAVKDISLKILENYEKDYKILASEEFEYSIKYYAYYTNSAKIPDITSYGYKDITSPIELAQEFIDVNKNLDMWFIGRENEQYFNCLNSDDIMKLIDAKNLHYEIYRKNDIYLIHILKV